MANWKAIGISLAVFIILENLLLGVIISMGYNEVEMEKVCENRCMLTDGAIAYKIINNACFCVDGKGEFLK